jgi:hypothetical protein
MLAGLHVFASVLDGALIDRCEAPDRAKYQPCVDHMLLPETSEAYFVIQTCLMHLIICRQHMSLKLFEHTQLGEHAA